MTTFLSLSMCVVMQMERTGGRVLIGGRRKSSENVVGLRKAVAVTLTDEATAAPATHAGSLSLPQGVALYVGAVLGTGVIALPALAARAAGPASLLAWVGLVLASIPLAATFA